MIDYLFFSEEDWGESSSVVNNRVQYILVIWLSFPLLYEDKIFHEYFKKKSHRNSKAWNHVAFNHVAAVFTVCNSVI